MQNCKVLLMHLKYLLLRGNNARLRSPLFLIDVFINTNASPWAIKTLSACVRLSCMHSCLVWLLYNNDDMNDSSTASGTRPLRTDNCWDVSTSSLSERGVTQGPWDTWNIKITSSLVFLTENKL